MPGGRRQWLANIRPSLVVTPGWTGAGRLRVRPEGRHGLSCGRDYERMMVSLTIDWLAIDCNDAPSLAEFWAAALDYRVLDDDDPEEVLVVPRSGAGTRLIFLKVPEGKSVKNRMHLDLRPDDRDAEVERLIGLGAKKVDIGQGDVTWVVLADPEGNEFCILRELEDAERAERAALGIA
jgi:predicted enzyme related to lactoylglutathione lyase